MNHKHHRRAVALWVTALFICMALAAALKAEKAIGIQNNNPGNIISRRWEKWRGAKGSDKWGHIVFKNPCYGIRAIKVNLKGYIRRGYNTPRKILHRWAPVAPVKQHRSYLKKVCYWAKIDPDKEIKIDDTESLKALAKGIVYGENGYDPYSDEVYDLVFKEE